MIVPVILCGGVGERLWPLSRPDRPKQFLALAGDESLLAQTARRLHDPAVFAPPIVVAGAAHRFTVAEHFRAAGLPTGRIVLEPMGRNTAPAVAAAALLAAADDPEALIVVAHSDAAIPDHAAFRAVVARGVEAAKRGRFVLFGVTPTHPSIAYGYIQAAEDIGGARRVARFVEKPDALAAAALIAAGDHFWNSGIFLMRAAGYLEELGRFAPEVLAGARAAVEAAEADADFLRLDAAAFAATPAISIDHAVMEKTDRAAVVEADFAWSDVGSWTALLELMDKDADGNASRGAAALEDAQGCLAWSDGPTIGLLGVRDLLVVATADGVLVSSREAEPRMRALIDRLKRI